MDGSVWTAAAALDGWYVAAHGVWDPTRGPARRKAVERLERAKLRNVPPAAVLAADALVGLGALVFCPTFSRRGRSALDRQAGGRRGGLRKTALIERHLPLFPGYLFFQPPGQAELDAVIRHSEIDAVLTGASERPFRVPAAAMALLFERQAAPERPKTWCSGYRERQALRIVDGPWTDLAGVYECDEAEGRIAMMLEVFGRFARVSLPSEIVEPINQQA